MQARRNHPATASARRNRPPHHSVRFAIAGVFRWCKGASIRILTRKLWRAFPELDRFSDEQCARFVRVATSGFGGPGSLTALVLRWLAIVLTVLILGGLLAVPAYWAAFHAFELAEGRNISASTLTRSAAGVFVCVAILVTFGAGLLLRDLLVRRRVRQVIAVRGRCFGCGYAMLGLPVPDDLKITCPECRFETWVDPALAELVTNEAGQRTLKPHPEARRLPHWVNRRLAWNVAKGAALLALVLIVGAAGWWAWNEHRLAAQAQRAQAARVGIQPLQAIADAYYPLPTPQNTGENDGWKIFEKVRAVYLQAVAEVRNAPDALVDEQGVPVLPMPRYIGAKPDSSDGARSQAVDQVAEMGRRVVLRFRALGGDDLLARLAAAPRAARDWQSRIPPGSPAAAVTGVRYEDLYQQAELTLAMMELARRDEDLPTYALALRSTLRLVHMAEREPLSMSRTLAIGIEMTLNSQLREHLAAGCSSEWLERVETELVASQVGTVPVSDVIKGESICAQDSISWLFSDPKHVRTQASIAAFADPRVRGGRVGTYEENIAAAQRWYDAYAARADQPRHSRTPRVITGATELAVLEILTGTMTQRETAWDLVKLDRTSLRLLLAIERYHAARAEYPASLDELVPLYIKSLPTDEFTGLGFGYRRVDPAQDDQHRAYLLYSLGVDATDNSGKSLSTRPGGPFMLNQVLWARDVGTGFDFIINDNRR